MKLILLEGLPGTGKSTNSGFLRTQYERNGYEAHWVHELARPHPVLFFQEAALTYEEYANYLEQYPETRAVLEELKIRREKTIGFDLLELEWNHRHFMNEEALRELRNYDVWNYSLARYKELALEKWRHWAGQWTIASNDAAVVILDSAIFQYQVFSFLLMKAPYEELWSFVQQLHHIIEPFQPALVYLYRERTEETIEYLINKRGMAFLEGIWSRDRHKPFYRQLPPHPDSYKQFLHEYARLAYDLFASAPCAKLGLELSSNSGSSWANREDEMLAILGLKRQPDPDARLTEGTYFNETLNEQLELRWTEEGAAMLDPAGQWRALVPRSEFMFYVRDFPVILHVQPDEQQVTVLGEQINKRWTTTGTIFRRMPGS